VGEVQQSGKVEAGEGGKGQGRYPSYGDNPSRTKGTNLVFFDGIQGESRDEGLIALRSHWGLYAHEVCDP